MSMHADGAITSNKPDDDSKFTGAGWVAGLSFPPAFCGSEDNHLNDHSGCVSYRLQN